MLICWKLAEWERLKLVHRQTNRQTDKWKVTQRVILAILIRFTDIYDLNPHAGPRMQELAGPRPTSQDLAALHGNMSPWKYVSTEICLTEIGLTEISLPEIGLPEIGLPEIGLPENGLPEIGLPEIGLPKIGLPEIGLPEIARK